MSQVKVLVSADIHLGRVSSRVASGDGSDLSARGAWERIVELAVREKVDLVCLAGDVADESNRFWEALGPLEKGLRTLGEAGITTLAVSGNHDHEALPRLADQLESDRFRLLGRGGKWERYTYTRDDAPLLHVDGWSFPRDRVRSSPVDSYEVSRDSKTPTLAMVHGDLDVADSVYAPLSREELRAKPVAGWLLGHIHVPMSDAPEGRPFITYPGSPQSLDPGERGVHGVVLVDFEHGRCVGMRTLPVSTVRYDHLDVDVAGVGDLEDLTSRVRGGVQAFAGEASREADDGLEHLVLRLTLHGQTSIAAELAAEAESIRRDFELEASGVRCVIDDVVLRVLPVIDLEALSQVATPTGMLASALLELRDDRPLDQLSERTSGLVDRVREVVVAQRKLPEFSLVTETDPQGREIRELVCEQCEALLIRLLQGQDGP